MACSWFFNKPFFGFLAALCVCNFFIEPLHADFPVKLPCRYQWYSENDLNKPWPAYRSYQWLELIPQKDGRIRVEGMSGTIPGKESELEGYGRFTKEGFFEFSFEDSRAGKGRGKLQFMEQGQAVKFFATVKGFTNDNNGVVILRIPVAPKKTEIITTPGKYQVSVPAFYQSQSGNKDAEKLNSVTLKFLDNGKIRIDGELQGESDILPFRGSGIFQDGDVFSFHYDDFFGNKGQGSLTFKSSKEVVLSMKIIDYSTGNRDLVLEKLYQKKYALYLKN